MKLNYERDSVTEERFPEWTDEAPVSGVHSSRGAFDEKRFMEEDLRATNDVEIYVSDFPAEIHREENEKPAQSWILRLLRDLKSRISSPPPAPEVKEFVPFDEQQLVDLLKMEEDGLKVFEMILENREMLHFNALAAGMSLLDIQRSEDSRFDPTLTDIWRRRVEEKRQLVADVRERLEIKRRERRLKYGVVPPYLRPPRF